MAMNFNGGTLSNTNLGFPIGALDVIYGRTDRWYELKSFIKTICHICGSSAEFHCRTCEELVCEDCCVGYTLHNQLDYTLCKECEDLRSYR